MNGSSPHIIVVSLHFWGKRRLVIGLVLLGLLSLAVHYFSFVYATVRGEYVEYNSLDGLYLIASAVWFLAACEQERLEPEEEDPEIENERYVVFHVSASGSPREIINRQREWHRKVIACAGDEARRFRISLDVID